MHVGICVLLWLPNRTVDCASLPTNQQAIQFFEDVYYFIMNSMNV